MNTISLLSYVLSDYLCRDFEDVTRTEEKYA
ncbi:MAG: hypothetical protein ACI8ZB_000852 [Desulforhopalus sp.]|jgi:hypothetical protein